MSLCIVFPAAILTIIASILFKFVLLKRTIPSTVSILMPVKNTALFLDECMRSILEQSYKNWELIAVNDHSEDGSYDVLQNYAFDDKRIKVINNTGDGIIAALRTAFDHAQGGFITRMDSDDIMNKDKISAMLQVLNDRGRSHLAIGLVEYFSNQKLGEGYQKYAHWLNALTMGEDNFSDIYRECTIPSPCWMIHRTDLLEAGGFNSDVYPEDYDLAFRFKKIGVKIVGVQKVLHYWRDYDTRTSRMHEHYSDNRFSALKVFHFLNQDRDESKELVLWGAGYKGKKIAQILNQYDVLFRWVCNNEKKIGKEIYGIQMESIERLTSIKATQVIVAVSHEHDEDGLSTMMKCNDNHQYFRFC